MKRSNTGLFIILGFVAMLIIATIVGARFVIGSLFGKDADRISVATIKNEDTIELDYDFENFNEIEIDGTWTINVKQGDSFAITVYCPEKLQDFIKVRKHGNAVHFNDVFSFSRIGGGTIHANITMPELEKYQINGAASVYISDFNQDHIMIEVNGAASVKGEKNIFQTIDFEINGAAQIDFGGSETKNADIDIEGAGSVILAITGGYLDGNINGLGTVKYYGEISDRRIDIDGLGSIKKLQ